MAKVNEIASILARANLLRSSDSTSESGSAPGSSMPTFAEKLSARIPRLSVSIRTITPLTSGSRLRSPVYRALSGICWIAMAPLGLRTATAM